MSFSTASFAKKLAGLQETQDSIVTISQWVLFHHRHTEDIAKLWASFTVQKGQPLAKRLSLLYLCNDVVQQAKHKKKTEFLVSFSAVLPEVLNSVYGSLDHLIKAKVDRLINVWEQRNVFQSADIASFKKAVDLSKKNQLLDKPAETPPPANAANVALVALDLTQLNTLYLHMNQLIDILQANLTQVGIQSKTYLPQNPSASDNLPSPKVFISKLNVLDRLCNISKENIVLIKKDRTEILRVLDTLRTLVSDGLKTDDSKISIIDSKLVKLNTSRDELKSILAENGDDTSNDVVEDEEPSPAYTDEAPQKADEDDDIVPTYEDSDAEDSPPPKKQKLSTPTLNTPTPSGNSTPSQRKSVAFSENIEIKEYDREDNTQVIKIVKSDDDTLEMEDVDEPVISSDFEQHHKDDLELKHDHESVVGSYDINSGQNDDDDGYDPSSGVDDDHDDGNSTVLNLLSKLA